MEKIKILKLRIIQDLREVINQNRFVYDIWRYGSFKDTISDLDLILIYEKKPLKINFPPYIRKLIDDGNIIYLNKLDKKNIFLFEQLKVYSILKKKKISTILSNDDKKNRNLTSFVERYYYSRIFLDKKYNKINNIEFRKIKSLFFSYKTFFKVQLNKNQYKKFRNIENRYYKIRTDYNLNKLKNRKYTLLVKDIKNFDFQFSNYSYVYLEKNFPNIRLISHTLKFTNNLMFIYKDNLEFKKLHKIKIPKLFFMLYFFYASQKLSLSSKIFDSFDNKLICSKSDLNNFFSKSFKKYLLKKINCLNSDYINLKKNKFKGGLYRFGWYL